jgi:hypothetical protein
MPAPGDCTAAADHLPVIRGGPVRPAQISRYSELTGHCQVPTFQKRRGAEYLD